MLTKLAFKNVGKSFRDYAVYFFTLVFGVCIFYMFNSIYAQQEIMVVTETMNESMLALRQILSYVSIFVAAILGFLIVYANNFFIRRRKKELGIYMTLGMTKRDISIILILETALMAIVALVVGLILGVFGSQFMSIFTAKLFEADLTGYKFLFAPSVALKSILYFGLIFIIVILFNTILIGKFQLIDLLYGGRKNETLKISKDWISIVIFIISLISLGISYFLIIWNGIINLNIYFTLSIVLGIVGTLLFFLSLAGILTKLMQTNKKFYFKNLNMFVSRQLSSKVNTNFISISIVCIVLLLVIGIFSSGYSMQNILSGELKDTIKYDFSIYKNSLEGEITSTIYENLPSEITNSNEIKDYYEYQQYRSSNEEISYGNYNLDLSDSNYDISSDQLKFVTISDYNGIRTLQGLEPVTLENQEYIVISNHEFMKKIATQFIDKNIIISIDNQKLLPKGNLDTTFLDNYSSQIVFIVNDDMVNSMTIDNSVLNIQSTNDAGAKIIKEKLETYQQNVDYKVSAFSYFSGRLEMYTQSITTKAIISFLAIYIGIVFMIACAAILAIQQLSEATDNKERYDLLKKLGTNKKMLNHALFVQILFYFLLPLLLAMVHSVVGLIAANAVIKDFGHVNIGSSLAVTAVFVIGVYGIYFILTYMGSKSIINKG